ncbi:MAG: polysaccharide pyruvyl transferase CsaB [Vulcanimicrobiota bacterium]
MGDQPLKLLLAGYFGFDNAGDEAIFESMVENFRRLDPSVELTALVRGEETARRLGVACVPRKDVGAVWKALRRSDLFVLGGGGLFQDVTGPGSVYYYGGLLLMAKLARCRSVFFCQGYGPVNGNLARFVTRQALRLPDLITVRDQESQAELVDLGVPSEQVHLAADPALLLSPLPVQELRALLGEEGLMQELGRSELPDGRVSAAGPLVAVTVRPWPNLPLEELGRALKAFREETGARYLLLPFQPERDLEPSRKLVELLDGEAKLLERGLTPAALTGILACSDMVIGMRLHSLILATVGNPPLYGLSYDPKVERFCRRAGALSCFIEEISSERLLREWKHVLNGRKTQRKSQEKSVSTMRGEVERAFEASLRLARGGSAEEVAQKIKGSAG